MNDFHLMLAPKLIKQRRPDLTVALFLHTTFSPPDVFAVVPWRRELLDGLLHLDLMGFHIPSYALNFANTVERFLGATPTSVVGTDLIADGLAVAVSRYPLACSTARTRWDWVCTRWAWTRSTSQRSRCVRPHAGCPVQALGRVDWLIVGGYLTPGPRVPGVLVSRLAGRSV